MINLKAKNLFGFKNPVWWTQEGDGCLINGYYPAISSSQLLGKYFSTAPKVTIYFCINRKFVWAYEANEMVRVSKKLIQESLKNSQYPYKLYRKWLKQVNDYYQVVNKINRLELSKISDQDFLKLFKEFGRFYKIEYTLPLLPDNYHEYAEKILLPKVQKYLKGLSIKEYEKAYLALLSPTKSSFIKQTHWSVLRLANQFKKGQNINHALKRHTKKFYWVHNNYTYTKYLDENFWLKEVKKHLNKNHLKIINQEKRSFQKIKKNKSYYIKKLKIDNRTALELKILDMFSHWQDQRKQANMIGNWIIDQFLRELSKRLKVNYWLLKHAIEPELIDIIKTKKVNQDLLKRRLKFSVIAVTPKSVDVLAYPKSAKLYQRMFPQKANNVKEIKGVVANRGQVKGRVRVITSSQQFRTFKKGEVLVASMTRPDYSVILHKASAIITDEGGLTCHAAIVSRELSVPCIIATKVATKVLKNGDIVEVDANQGVVKVIK